MILQSKIERVFNRYYPINWDDPDPSLENELEALIFDEDTNFNPIDDDIEQMKEDIMNTLYQLNHDRKTKEMIADRVRHMDSGFTESYPKKY